MIQEFLNKVKWQTSLKDLKKSSWTKSLNLIMLIVKVIINRISNILKNHISQFQM